MSERKTQAHQSALCAGLFSMTRDPLILPV